MTKPPPTAAFNAEAVRAYLFTAAQEVAAGLAEAKAEGGEAALLTGAVEFAVQLWVQVSLRAGVTPKAARETLEKEVRLFIRKHVRAEQAGPKPARAS